MASTPLTDSVTIREFTARDYEALATVRNLLYPEHPSSPAELRVTDEQADSDPRLRHARWLAVSRGEVIAFAEYSQNPGSYHPQRFLLEGGVLPEHRGRGIGRRLYAVVTEALETYHPISYRTKAREDWPASLCFLAARGFREDKRFWESTLDVAAFDHAPFAGLQERLEVAGIRFTTAAELSGSDPAWQAKLHDLFSHFRQDIPRAEPATEITLEQYVEWILGDSMTILDAFFVAVHRDRYVGSSDLYKSESSPDYFTGVTGVRREYRGRGIALALKLRAIDYARARGVARIRTDNASNNRPMLAVNEKLGFVKEPAWISLVNELGAR